jgi:transposase
MDQRKAKANQLCGLASEYGLVAPNELLHLRSAVPRWLEASDNGLSERFRRLLRGLWQDLKPLDERIGGLDLEIEQLAQQDEVAIRLQKVRGIGPLTATALLATVGTPTNLTATEKWMLRLGLRPNKLAREEKSDCLVLASGATLTCSVSSCMAPER